MIRLLVALLCWANSGFAQDCRQALAIGLDVSASVDDAEYGLQTGGLAAALLDPKVQLTFLQATGRPVWLTVYDWSGPWDMRVILPWIAIRDEATLYQAAAIIRKTARNKGAPQTAVGASMRFGAGLLAMRSGCVKQTLDLTGDGLNNAGPRPRNIQLPSEITVNALVIGADREASWDGGEPGVAELSAWFNAEVIRGPNAFVEVALGFDDFKDAMVRKLLRELEGIQIGQVLPKETGR